jgi:hypothetical protein
MPHVSKLRKPKKDRTIPICLVVFVFGISVLCYISSNCDCKACTTPDSTQACKYR